MEKAITFLFFLPLVITDPLVDSWDGLPYDITTPLIYSINEILQLANSHTIRNLYDESTSQHPPFVIVNSKNITFSKFLSDEEIISFLDLDEIICTYHKHLSVTFKRFGAEQKNKSIEGNVSFLHPTYHTSICQFPFNIQLHQSGNFILYFDFQNPNAKPKNFRLYSTFEKYETIFQTSNSEEILCKNANEHQLQYTYEDILVAIENRIRHQLELITKSTFQSISDKCRNPSNEFRENTQEYSSYLKLDRTNNIEAFPWMNDYNELIIKGLTSTSNSFLYIKYMGNEKVNYEYNFTVTDVSIVWNVTSIDSKQFGIEVGQFRILGRIDDDLSVNDPSIDLMQTIAKESNKYYALPEEMMAQLNAHIADGIKQTFQRMSYIRNIDVKIPITIAEILRSFDKRTFETVFLNPEEPTQIDFSLGTILFSKVEVKGTSHLENITCSLQENSMIGHLVYNRITAKFNYWHYVNETRISSIYISGEVHIENAAIRIFLEKYPDSTKEIEVNLDHTFNDSSSGIMIDPAIYLPPQQELTVMEKEIIERFVEMIKNRIIHTTKSILSPILEVCQNSFSTFHESFSNRRNLPKQFLTSIEDRWNKDTKQVDIIINGWWNYQFINIQHVNDSIIVNNLRIENITTNVKQFDIDSKGTILSNYTISYILLTINHKDKDVLVKIPELVADHTTISIHPNITSSAQDETNVLKNLELTIASFIEQLLYGKDPNYHEKFRKSVDKAMENAIPKYEPTKYDSSPIFTQNFVHKLGMNLSSRYDELRQNFRTAITNSYYLDEAKFQVDLLSLVMITRIEVEFGRTFILDEICDHFGHSLIWIDTKDIPMHLTYTANIVTDSNEPFVNIPFKIDVTRVKLTYNHSDATLQLQSKFDNKNILQFQLPLENTSIMQHLRKTKQDDLRKKFVQITSSFLNRQLHVNPSIVKTFCGLSQEIINETGSVSSTSLERHFYSINNTIEYASRRFLIYHIQIYGLLNFSKISFAIADTQTTFEFTIRDLKARILWSYYVGGLIPKIPVIKEIDLQIDEIFLAGKIILNETRLAFTNSSRMKFNDQENTPMKRSMLKKTFEPIVLNSIQQAITVEFYKRRIL